MTWGGHINESGLSIIKVFEGFSETVYRDPVGIPTIGYGSIWDLDGSRIKIGRPSISKAEAVLLLQRELEHVEKSIRWLVQAPLTSNQFSALASWTYNLGSGNLKASTLRKKLNRENFQGAADEFPKWRRAGGRILKGLVRRRAAERELFLT